jgi:predicted nucleic acid-binding protein
LTLVVDASVAVKWFFEEPGQRRARALLNSGQGLIAPSLVLAEVVNAVWKRYTRGEIGRRDADDVVRLVRRPFADLVPLEALVPQAASIALNLSHPIYDCFYLALAAREALPLVTADRRMSEAGAGAGIEMIWLS